MNQELMPHNSHWEEPSRFRELDPQLRRLAKQPYQHHSTLLDKLPFNTPGIYTIGGGRQIGKSTLMKLWIEQLLEKNVNPKNILYITGELIDNHHQLVTLLTQAISAMPKADISYVIIDEVTYISHWDKAVKYLSDTGLLDKTILTLTGSDLVIMKEAIMTFPGRRGTADVTDFHMFPLSFYETIKLKNKINNLDTYLTKSEPVSGQTLNDIMLAFNEYLIHGGYLVAINDIKKYKKILPATLQTYSQWIRGDVVKRHKQDHNLKEIITAILQRYGSQITWNTLAQTLSIEHPQTVADYMALLQSMDALFIQHALLEDKLVGAPKKAKKVFFSDPFIFHAMQSWINETENPYESLIVPAINNPMTTSLLVETAVVNHMRRHYSTYYIKATGEVDVAYIKNKRFWPIELKWTTQLRSKDLKQILKYKNGEIWAKSLTQSELQGIPVSNLPWQLLKLSHGFS